MCGRSGGSADSEDGSGIVEPMPGSGSKESWRVMISIQFFKNHFLLRAEGAGVRVFVHGGFPGERGWPVTSIPRFIQEHFPNLRHCFHRGKFPDNPMHLVTQRDSGTGGLSEGGGNVCLEGVVGHLEGSLQGPWRGQR